MIRLTNETTQSLSMGKTMKNIEPAILKSILSSSIDMTFGYEHNDVSIYFITALNEEENEIPHFTRAISMNSLSNKPIVVLDIRNIFRGLKDGAPLTEMVSNPTVLNAMVIEAIALINYKAGNDTDVKKIGVTMGMAMANVLGNTLMLNQDDISKLAVVITYSILTIYDDEISDDLLEHYALSAGYGLPADQIKQMCSSLDRVFSTSGIIKNISTANISETTNKDLTAPFVNARNSLVFGPRYTTMSGYALETPVVAKALIWEVLNNRLLKRTKLFEYMDRNKRSLKLEEIILTTNGALKKASLGLTQEDMTYSEDKEKDVWTADVSTSNHSLFISGNKYKLYISSIADDAQSLHTLLDALDAAPDKSSITCIIASGGGIVEQGIQLIQALERNFGDRITTVLDVKAASMATIVFLKGTRRVATKYSRMMFHTFSTMAWGKSQEISSSIESASELITAMNKEFYVDPGYFTEEEFASMNDGKDFWFGFQELLDRGILTHVDVGGKLFTVEQYKKLSS